MVGFSKSAGLSSTSPGGLSAGAGLSLFAGFSGESSSFSPLSLFSASEPGVWYDPSDLTTLFQDAAGTTPVTGLEQPVGLMLDKSKGLVYGAELISNGSFASGTSNWTAINSASISAAGGELTVTAGSGTGNTFGGAQQTITTVIGKRYFIVASVKTTSKRIGVALGGAGGYPTTTSTSFVTLQFSFVASATSSDIGLFFDNTAVNGDTFTVRSVSVRELPGNHASQSTAASRPVLSARVNLLTYSEQFDNAAWIKGGFLAFGSGSTANAANAPDGTLTADLLTPDTTLGLHRVVGPILTIPSGTPHRYSVYVKPNGYTKIGLREMSTTGDYAAYSLSGAGSVLDKSASATATVTALSDGWYLVSASIAATATSIRYSIYVLDPTYTSGAIEVNWTPNGTSGVYLWGADWRVTNDGVGLPAYQRVGAATSGSSTASGTADYDTVGFPVYLRFDGTDDSAATGNIDFSGTDKMSVVAGVRKLSEGSSFYAACIAELSAASDTTNGSFLLFGRDTFTPGYYEFGSRGTTFRLAATNDTAYAAPITNILTGLGDISGDTATLRVNGAQVAQTTTDQGTGNYGNHALNIGRRPNATLQAHIRLYGLLVIGRTLTATEIANMEDWMEAKTFGKDMAYIYSDELTTAEGDSITADDGDQIYMSVNYQ